MKFSPISIEEYVKNHLKNNPSENGKDLRKRLEMALADYKKGVKCSCGNDIWVIGAATVGILCNLTRIDQKDAKEFICFGYKERK